MPKLGKAAADSAAVSGAASSAPFFFFFFEAVAAAAAAAAATGTGTAASPRDRFAPTATSDDTSSDTAVDAAVDHKDPSAVAVSEVSASRAAACKSTPAGDPAPSWAPPSASAQHSRASRASAGVASSARIAVRMRGSSTPSCGLRVAASTLSAAHAWRTPWWALAPW